MSLHIGTMMPDRALDESALINAITKVAADLARLRDRLAQKQTPVLDIVFLLPSRQEKADFSGLRLRSYDAARQVLRIEVRRTGKNGDIDPCRTFCDSHHAGCD